MENLIELPDQSEAGIAQNLHERFKNGQTYTKASNVLVFVNNFEKLTQQTSLNTQKCHISGVSQNALQRITRMSSNSESIVFGGESGSGKSTNAFKVFNFLTSQPNSKVTTKHSSAIESVFKSFGCAKTLKNDEATRYGCSMDLLYKRNVLTGLNLKYTVPLEVPRVISQKPGERNFNVFYEVYHGLNDEMKAKFGIKGLQKFFYINQGNSTENIQSDVNHFKHLEDALHVLGFSDDHCISIYKIISTILHIGNIYFRTKRNPNVEQDVVEIGNMSEVKWVAFLLDVDFEKLLDFLLPKSENGTTIDLNSALDNRDSFAMLIYEELFKWVINRIGLHLKCPLHTGVISILDQYGFEKFNNNGVDEFLINSVNERLENLFVKHSFHDQLVDYAKDGITVDYKVPTSIENGKTVELLFKKPYGLLPLLTDECKFPKGNHESYLEHCNLNHTDRSSYGKARNRERMEFGVRHCIGTTWYNVNDFFSRNKRIISFSAVQLLRGSKNPIIGLLVENYSSNTTDQIVSQAQFILRGAQEIAEKINGSHAYFVRCIKSNNERQTKKFDIPLVNRQIKNLLLAELLSFRIKGYPVKMSKTSFARQYRCLLPGDIAMCQNEKEIIQDILQGQGVKYENDFKIGTEYVFLRERLADRYESQQNRICSDAAIVIQKNLKSFVAQRIYKRKRAAIIKLQAGLRGWKARRDYISKREEMFKAIGRTMKRNKRLDAYHQALGGENSGKLQHTLVGYIDINEDAKKALERPTSDSEATETLTQYLTIPVKTFLPNMRSISLEQYAEENFKGHLLESRREPIMTPFLHKESEYDFRLSVEIFKLVLKYMNDRKFSKKQQEDLGRYIVQQGISNPCQRDEILVQIINQIHGNPDKTAIDNGWKLVHMAISVFPPTENIIPMLVGFFKQEPAPLREQLFGTLQRRLKIYDSEIAREHPPSNLELQATPNIPNTVAEINCYDGLSYDIHLNPWSTTSELAERILKQRGVGFALGWTVEVETPNRVFVPTGNHFIHDVFSQIEGANMDLENQQSIFFNFPPEKLVKKVAEAQKPELVEPEVTMTPKQPRKYPTPEEWMNQPPQRTESRNTPMDHQKIDEESDESLVREYNEEAGYAYTLPRKNNPKPQEMVESETSESEESVEDDNRVGYETVRPKENMKMQETIQDHSHILKSPILPRKTYSRTEHHEEYTPMNFAPPPTFTYPQQHMPMMQYVPVMMTSSMIPGQQIAMIPQQMMMQPQFSYVPQYPQIPQYRPPEPILSPQSVRSDVAPMMAAPVMYDGHESTRSRDIRKLKRGEVPSQYSTIRNMPVPEHGKDVDQFLDAVFDQCLSKDEQRAAEFSAHQLAGTIKGGKVRPDGYYEPPSPPQQTYSPAPRYPTLCRVDDSPARSRAKSLPRIISPRHHDHYVRRPHSRNSYSNESTSSDDQINYRTRSRERSLPRFHSNNGYNYDPSQPVYMMPVQMNGHGEMILLSPTMRNEQIASSRHGTHDRSRRHVSSGVERYMAKRSPSVDILKPHLSRRTPDMLEQTHVRPATHLVQSPAGRRFEEFSALPRADSRARERMENPLLARQYQRTFPYQNGTVVPPPPSSYRSPSPAPTSGDRRGLSRLPQEAYVEQAVKNTKNNSEYLSPHRFNLDEQKAVIRHEKETAKNALNMLSDRLKKLPPPVDNVRLIRPVTPQRPVTPAPPSPEQLVYVRPPSPIPQPTPPPPPPPQIQQPIRHEWVVKDAVERDPETQGRIRGSFIKEPLVPQPPKAPVATEKSAVKFVKAPWKLTIRKEMFYPGEVLNDIQIIDQVFAQIVEDCKKSYPYRIRLEDRKQVEDVLRAHEIPPSDLNNQSNIHPDVKVAIIERARLWPLYFNQVYEVTEKRPDESVSTIFAISEHGIRLIIHTPHDLEHPLKIQDFFPFETIADVSLEANDILSVHVRHENEENAYTAVRIKTNQAPQIKKTLEKCLSGGVVPKRKFVRALEDYVTSEVNHLSFKQGDVIELLPSPESETPPVGNWMYGRIENRFGYLLAQYVDSAAAGDNIPPIRSENSAERDERVKFFDDEVPFSSERYTMLDFATKYFRKPKDKKKQEEWAWEDISQAVRYSEKPISHSLLADLGSDESKYAVETFHAIMKFMGDEPLKKSESMTDVVFKVLIICHRQPTLRDEVYCQLIKQTTSNTSNKPNSSLRAWRLLTIITAYFPSSLTLKPYILQYLGDNADDWQRPYHGTARICQTNMIQTFKYGGRKVLLNALEVQQITDGSQLRRQAFFISREHSVNQTLRPIAVAEEMIQELCSLLNVRSLHEQQEFSLCYTVGKEKRLNYCKNDSYLMDIITECEHKKLPFQFHLKRTVWVHPLRYDNAAYIDSMFDQLIDDYLRGSLISTNSLGQLTAATTEEIIKLAAYLFLLLPNDNAKRLTAKTLPQIVPKSVIEPKHRHQEEMVTRINRQLKMFGGRMRPAEAKSHFLELLSTWPLFGVLHYRLKSVVENGNQLPEVILTINKSGIQLLQPKSREVFKQRNYDQIESVESIRKTAYRIVRLVINTPEGEEALDIKTDEADEISHLIGQYMFVTGGVEDRDRGSSTEL
ncbi:hypothetical protein L3Y34_011038 [Caenorhabditis briggsae]|uniref:Uncharacterized protein n=1 Tax=Caenorhabditis briggsae TaxID=6238 RepID=A0AAE8ZQE2_CAEBR|nr:hypothetical protein L3Y34_011038 [Caenorhabditis briggsae]